MICIRKLVSRDSWERYLANFLSFFCVQRVRIRIREFIANRIRYSFQRIQIQLYNNRLSSTSAIFTVLDPDPWIDLSKSRFFVLHGGKCGFSFIMIYLVSEMKMSWLGEADLGDGVKCVDVTVDITSGKFGCKCDVFCS